MAGDPLFSAGYAAGIEAAAAYLEGRASMAGETGRDQEAKSLMAARDGLLRIKPTTAPNITKAGAPTHG